MNDHIKKHRDEINARIRGTYGINDSIQKSEENELEKGGEGSKGGKVIGHTPSGKAVYEHFEHEGHKDFTAEDHNDAAKIHAKFKYDPYQGRNKKHVEKYRHHQAEKNKHFAAEKDLKNKKD